MNHQIANKLAAVVFAVLMNVLVLGSVSYLFAPPQTAMAQPIQAWQGTRLQTPGVA